MYKRYHILILLLAFLLLTGSLNGQEKITFPLIDKATYNHYISGNWDSILHYGKLAKRYDISYYYLDLRMGLARYNKKQYFQASRLFREAVKKNGIEDLPKEYLYYTYLFTGQYPRADILSRKFSPNLSERIPGFRPKFFTMINPETVLSYTDGKKLENQLMEESVDGHRHITSRFAFFQIALSHQPAACLTIHQGISFLHKKNILYFLSGASEVFLPDMRLNQMDYFIIPEFSFRSGTSISPSFHYTGINSEVLETINSGSGRNASVTLRTEFERFLLGGIEITQKMWLFDLTLAGSYLARDEGPDYQQKIGGVFYPLGNLNLYLGADYYFTDLFQSKVLFENNIWHTIIGVSIKERVWIEARYTEGNMKNFRENNNTIFYNSTDFMNRKAQLHLSVFRKDNKGNFYIGGRWANNVAPYVQGVDGVTDMNNTFEFNSYTIYGGISWKI
ncbi:MAG TPA: hypothetical protein ENN61_05060 [Bacteroidaceae bacterium]|nr:hypothetical protein [Bacteroidaceae bacterium]